jgi:hypothetical protein
MLSMLTACDIGWVCLIELFSLYVGYAGWQSLLDIPAGCAGSAGCSAGCDILLVIEAGYTKLD